MSFDLKRIADALKATPREQRGYIIKDLSPSDLMTDLGPYILAEVRRADDESRDHIENVLGLEPDFQVIDTKREGNADPRTRFEVFDAEMTSVCACEHAEHADLIRDLLERATLNSRG